MLVLVLVSPLMAINALLAVLRGENVTKEQHKIDALGRRVTFKHFNCGVLKSSPVLWQVLKGDLHFCGATCEHRVSNDTLSRLDSKKLPSGLVSLHALHSRSGLAISCPDSLYQKQAAMSSLKLTGLLVRFAFNAVFYRSDELASPARLPLYGLNINNTQMEKAIAWFTDGTFFRGIKRSSLNLQRPKISFFVNANSVNLAQRNPEFKAALKKADCLFGDGSGIRVAARSRQLKLLDNINGTDVLPLLCKAMQQQNKRLFLLGAKPGIAQKMADNMKKLFPELEISGVQHGYFAPSQNNDIIQHINSSKTDVLLVAQGSPLQETWVIDNAAKLDCESVLAVGGLFDFYSGEITRAPMWMRETGLEWVWRLMQEPVTKFNRYVIGVPEFMFRTFVLKQANQE
ncbi:hypothetical protein MACH26_37690 [Planctobacterium marinum]|uniref:N-acetylmannosaminyltransferase n=2 Tax=Planctobacterium marinum TaxID=1631968 RepID=A0AA48HYN1_9ALTE|nr:hypothetical protein MACH26_37690 [Planctobacterium marinum]